MSPTSGPNEVGVGGRVARVSRSFMEARLLLLGVELGIYERLAQGAASGEELASALGLTRRGVRVVCDALAALDLLCKDGDRYQNSAEVDALLVAGRPGSLAHITRHRARVLRSWARLDELVRRGSVARDRSEHPLTDPAANRSFALGMAEVSRDGLDAVVDALPLRGARHLVDLGGGPAHYLLAALRRHPQLQGTLVDLPLTVTVAQEEIAAAGLGARARAIACDVYRERELPLEAAADVVLISQVLHVEGPDENRALLRKLAPHVAPGGFVAVVDKLVDETRTQPAAAALAAVNLLANTARGSVYTAAEVAAWLDEAGFAPQPAREVGERAWLILARKRRVAGSLANRGKT